MAEQQGKPTKSSISYGKLLPLCIGLVLFFSSCFGSDNPSAVPVSPESLTTPTIAPDSRPPASNAALTRVASSLAESHDSVPTVTALPVTSPVAAVPLPTVTPTLVPLPVTTRTVEFSGDVTLHLQLNSNTFESNGQPITMKVELHNYVLGGDTLSQSDKWCMQVGPTGLVFDLTYTLQPVSQNLNVNGQLQLYDGFCGKLGKLGSLLSTVPMNVTVPVGASAQLAPALQVQGSFLGLPNLIGISTGVFLNLNIRNPNPR